MKGLNLYAELKYRAVNGRRMAYIDEGAGDSLRQRILALLLLKSSLAR